jgi:hypothetical protein
VEVAKTNGLKDLSALAGAVCHFVYFNSCSWTVEAFWRFCIIASIGG